MDSVDLLARENEFKKLKKQLEKKTESLMKEIEDVMQKQDIFSDFSHKLTLTPTRSVKKHQCSPPRPEDIDTHDKHVEKCKRKILKSPKNTEEESVKERNTEISKNESKDVYCMKKVICDCCVTSSNVNRTNHDEFIQAFVSVSVQDNVLPKNFLKETISIESICKFLSSKVKLLQEQIDVLQVTINKKAAQCKSHLTQQAELEGERMSLLNKNNNHRAAVSDAKAKAAALEQRLAEKDRLYKEQRSECDRLTCEVKRLRVESAAAATRHAACDEQIATLTQRLKAAKAEHVEFRDSTRALSASNQNTITTLEARIKALNSTIDKQCSLIDNLRRQNVILKTEGAVSALEKDYSSFLSQDL